MKFKIYFLIFCTMSLSELVSAISFYHIQYDTKIQSNPIKMNGLMILNDEGGGLLRLRYNSPKNASTIVLEYDLSEEDAVMANGKVDGSKLYLNALEERMIVGEDTEFPQAPKFLFLNQKKMEEMVLKGIVSKNSQGKYVIQESARFKSVHKQIMQMDKVFMSQYFSEDEEYFKQFFTPVTRSIRPEEKGIKMHVVVVANTLSKDIGNSCKLDTGKVLRLFRDISNYLGVKMTKTEVAGKSFTKSALLKALNGLSPASTDIVVFYYSGHGFSVKTDPHKFPYLDMRIGNAEDHIKEAVNLETIESLLKSKGARLNLIFSDCCNSRVEESNAKGSKPMATKSSGILWSELNCKTLFFTPSKQTIVATAAETGQKAASNDEFGGFFSHFLRSSMLTYCSSAKPFVSWDMILDETQRGTNKKALRTYCDSPYIKQNICNQLPYYQVKFGD
ncbi:MAG: caspase family protein [Chitinophagaceae bacterium]|nr:caspase family protein [Chitinophagaceae bacterium]